MSGLPKIIAITGTDTDVGKTVATAALACALAAQGARVVAYKPAQTGVTSDEEGDMPFVRRVAGIRVSDGVRLREPMAPVQAAALEDRTLPTLATHVDAIRALSETADHVLVEGAGGLLVELDGDGHTLADLALAVGAAVVVVVRAGLGTLNHTMLTLEALQHRQIPVLGLVVGSVPAEPGSVIRANLEHLRALGDPPIVASIPAGVGELEAAEFAERAVGWCSGPHALVVRHPVG